MKKIDWGSPNPKREQVSQSALCCIWRKKSKSPDKEEVIHDISPMKIENSEKDKQQENPCSEYS